MKQRSGHHQPPTSLKHYGPSGHILLSSSIDRSLRSFSIIRDEQNTELSQGHIQSLANKQNIKSEALKLGQILMFDAKDIKEREWDNIITCHSNDSVARTWSYARKAIGKHTLRSTDGANIKAVCMSHCGNFGITGSAEGTIDKFNMQSGIHRTKFIGHRKAITALVSDQTNSQLYSTSLDKSLRIWDFKTGKELHSIDFKAPVSHMVLALESGLLALATDDFTISILDPSTLKIVRVFNGHTNRLTCLCFSPDERWIISTSLDSSVRTWDLVTGHMIDAFATPDLPTSISFSPVGNFIATTHVGHVGICIWTNRSLYEHVVIKKTETVREIDMPQVEIDEHQETEELMGEDSERTEIVDELISFSNLPTSRWQNLLSLEHIKV